MNSVLWVPNMLNTLSYLEVYAYKFVFLDIQGGKEESDKILGSCWQS